MGLVFSVVCSFLFCVERSMTWVLCCFFLLFIMAVAGFLAIYGITIGYHMAQKRMNARMEQRIAYTDMYIQRTTSRLPFRIPKVGREMIDNDNPPYWGWNKGNLGALDQPGIGGGRSNNRGNIAALDVPGFDGSRPNLPIMRSGGFGATPGKGRQRVSQVHEHVKRSSNEDDDVTKTTPT